MTVSTKLLDFFVCLLCLLLFVVGFYLFVCCFVVVVFVLGRGSDIFRLALCLYSSVQYSVHRFSISRSSMRHVS